jgi:hypothetical protein
MANVSKIGINVKAPTHPGNDNTNFRKNSFIGRESCAQGRAATLTEEDVRTAAKLLGYQLVRFPGGYQLERDDERAKEIIVASTLNLTDRSHPLTDTVALYVTDAGKSGDTDPVRICNAVLKRMRGD